MRIHRNDGAHASDQNVLFYDFNLEQRMPDNHLLRKIDQFLNFDQTKTMVSPLDLMLILINESAPNASKLREISIIVGCAVRTNIPASKHFHGAHGAPYTGKHS
ncbi:MAG: hypothetical protein QNL03_05370 [Gammaproteobacteria bacterium]|nr:hypothetical protein [Gammaproteobacteria bacterium]